MEKEAEEKEKEKGKEGEVVRTAPLSSSLPSSTQRVLLKGSLLREPPPSTL